MDDARRVDVLQAAQHLIDEELHVVVGQSLCANDVVQVGAHQMGHQVDLLKSFERFAVVESVQQADDVLVVHVLQQPQFAERSLGMGGRLEGPVQLLDGHLGVRDGIHGGAEN